MVPATLEGARKRWGLVLLAAALCASLPFTVSPHYDKTPDGALYILTARSLLSGEGYTYLGEPFLVRPPGLPMLLVPVLFVFGTSVPALNAAVSLMGVLCVCLMYELHRKRLGIALALCLALAIWIHPAFQRLCNQTLSDVPGAAALFACLVLARCSSRRSVIGLAAALGAAVLIRSANLVLVPALALSCWSRKDPVERPAQAIKRLSPALAAGVLAALAFGVRNELVASPQSAEQVYLHSYGTAMWHENPGDATSRRLSLAEVMARVPEQMAEMVGSLGNRLRDEEPSPAHFWLGLLALSLWAALAVRRRDAADLCAAGLIAMLAFYFAFKPRLMLPIALIVVPSSIEALMRLLSGIAGSRAARAALCVLVPAAAGIDALRAERPSLEKENRERRELCEDLARRLPPDAAIAAPHGWHYSVFLGRPVYSLQIVATRSSLLQSLALLDKYSIQYFITEDDNPGGQHFLAYFKGRYPLELRHGPYHVFRVRP